MAARENNSNALMDWVRPLECHGPLVSAVLATFSLKMDGPDFFSQDFLPSVFALGGIDGSSRVASARLDRRLAESDVALICDAHALASGVRPSLRVHVLPIGDQVQHAKIVLLHRRRHIRLIVGSANLSDDGYRASREATVVLDFHPGGSLPMSLLQSAVRNWLAVLGSHVDTTVRKLLEDAAAACEEWKGPRSLPSGCQTRLIFGGGATPLWQQVTDAWPEGEPLMRWVICSPFWPDMQDDVSANPFGVMARALSTRAARLDACEMDILTRASALTETAIPLFPFELVQQLQKADFPIRKGRIIPVRLAGDDDEATPGRPLGTRALHAKWMILTGPRTTLAVIGSANFTRKGYGTVANPARANMEACVLLRRPTLKFRAQTWMPPVCGRIIPWHDCSVGDLGTVPKPPRPVFDWPVFLKSVDMEVNWDGSPEPEGLLHVNLQTAESDDFVLGMPAAVGDETSTLVDKLGGIKGTGTCSLSPAEVRTLMARPWVVVTWAGGTKHARFPINITDASKTGIPCFPGAPPSEDELLAHFHGRISQDELSNRLEARTRADSFDQTETIEAVASARELQNYAIRDFVEGLYGMARTISECTYSPRAAEIAILGEWSPLALAGQILEALRGSKRTATGAAFQFVELLRLISSLDFDSSQAAAEDTAQALPGIRRRALDRLWSIVQTAANVEGFCAAVQDEGFLQFVDASLSPELATRWRELTGPSPSAPA